MTQEDKELLLKDLCVRLPYHPIVYVDKNLPRLKLGVATRVWEYVNVDKPCKPYLRPMSSMTEEEYVEYSKLWNLQYEFPTDADIRLKVDVFDWLNAHHFDYRGLIEKGIALEAPERMYNLNK